MQAYSQPERAADPHALPDVEVFYQSDNAARAAMEDDPDHDFSYAGWYYWFCLPGCLPDCTFTHDDKAYTSGGAVVTDDYVIAYVGKRYGAVNNRTLLDWHGNVLGTCWYTGAWPIRSFMSRSMHQIRATINGRRYTGRGMGEGMICRLRPVRGQ